MLDQVQVKMPAIHKNRVQTKMQQHCCSQQNRSKFYFINDLQKILRLKLKTKNG